MGRVGLVGRGGSTDDGVDTVDVDGVGSHTVTRLEVPTSVGNGTDGDSPLTGRNDDGTTRGGPVRG